MAVALAGDGHAIPEGPQLATSVLELQVLPKTWKPLLHARPHDPALHTGTPFASEAQTLPHAPQLWMSLFAFAIQAPAHAL